jgi:hypothetical protein
MVERGRERQREVEVDLIWYLTWLQLTLGLNKGQ